MRIRRCCLQLVACAALLVGASASSAEVASIAIPGLTARDYVAFLEIVRKLGDFDGYSSFAVSWDSDGLRQSAVMNVPHTRAPEAGYPILIICHGNANGRWDAFKEYYSSEQETSAYRGLTHGSLITRYAKEGFVVLFPDYRGHGYSETNGKIAGQWQLDRQGRKVVDARGEPVARIFDNDGMRFGGWLYTAHYTIDVLNLIAALESPGELTESLTFDLDNLFLWGRSLGGDVAARALTVSDSVSAASLWVPATTSLWDQAHHYHYDSPCCADGFSMEALAVELEKHNALHDERLVARDLNPANFVEQVRSPVMIQVSIDDPGARSAWGIQYHYVLDEHGVESELVIHSGDEHVFSGDTLERAIQSDLAFFRRHMK